ncbi:unnamed protein product [Linum trigynum]|uniref:Uncharacterized protein n=1 Tax=Linum trigynum TaxID=586398 RepID=A0AAV2CUX9_9ROSI
MQIAHLLLGRPWQFDRKVTHEGWTNYYKFQHQGKKFVLKPLSPDDVYNDQKQMEAKRNMGGESGAQMWVQRRIGFNFMSFQKLQNKVPALEALGCHDLCSTPAKQSSECSHDVDKDKGRSRSEITTDGFLKVEGITTSQIEAPYRVDGDQISPSTSCPELCSPVTMAQSKRENEWGGLTGDHSKPNTSFETFNPTPGMSGVHSFDVIKPEFEESNSPKVPLFVTQMANEDPLLGEATQIDSTQFGATETSREILGTCLSNQFILTQPESEMPKLKFFGRKFEEEKNASIGAIGSESAKKKALDKFMEVQGRSRDDQFVLEKPK